MESWMLGPPLLIGEKVFYSKNGTTVIPGTVRWLGKLPDCFGNQMVAGLALVRFLCSNTKSIVCNIILTNEKCMSIQFTNNLLSLG